MYKNKVYKAILSSSMDNYEETEPVFVELYDEYITLRSRKDNTSAKIMYERILEAKYKYKTKIKRMSGWDAASAILFAFMFGIPTYIVSPVFGLIVILLLVILSIPKRYQKIPFLQLIYFTSKGDKRGATLTYDKTTWSNDVYKIYDEICKRTDIKEK